ncbi:hypothetical protein C1O66_03650 [Paucibacter aquatile]|uniref:OmpA-like domain-containing protein n=1 Tax=Kinneretia aquatilis TaxID=2070761 RepID=A0A2N8KTE5_9BURK|nr:OmpA family protein [Paucibacter aquatile]PND36724.1 hypothetical protein C1O66_03650 [Paucibacter aquatile]
MSTAFTFAPSSTILWRAATRSLSAFALLAAGAVAGTAVQAAPGAATAPASAASAAAPAVLDLGSKVPDLTAVKEGLFPEDMCEELIKNGFKCMGFKPATTFSLSAVAFALGSAVLPDSLKQQLDVFAEVLKAKRGAAQKIRIVGHADSSGNEAGNLQLSQRRAEEVKRYLVNKGADAGMLEVTGVGSKDLLRPEAPTAAENRRVTLGR